MTAVEQENTNSAFHFPAFASSQREHGFGDCVENDYGPEDLKALRDVIERIRNQLYFIIHSIRCWRERHAGFENAVRLRYSSYEGAMCYADLRRHWAYYRHAVREYKRALEVRV